MVSLVSLWLPIVLSAVFVFIASSVINMALKFWHMPEYRGFSNEGEVGAAMRNGNAGPGLYMIPFCSPEAMKNQETQQKFASGPVGVVFLRRPGPMNMGAYLGQWFVFCLAVSFFCAGLAGHAVPPAAPGHLVFHTVALAALLGYGFGVFPDAIWWGHPWRSAVKYFIDGVVYAVVTGATFVWLWPSA